MVVSPSVGVADHPARHGDEHAYLGCLVRCLHVLPGPAGRVQGLQRGSGLPLGQQHRPVGLCRNRVEQSGGGTRGQLGEIVSCAPGIRRPLRRQHDLDEGGKELGAAHVIVGVVEGPLDGGDGGRAGAGRATTRVLHRAAPR